LARYGRKGKRYDTIDITQNIAIRYDTMHEHNVKFNARTSDDCSETADTGTCAAISNGRMIGSVNRRQRDIGTGDSGDAAVVDRQVVSCTRSRTIDDVVSSAT